MTNASEYWNRLCYKTPRLAGDGTVRMTMTIAEFRRSITRAYEVGQEEERRRRAGQSDQAGIVNESEGDFGDILGRMFGGRN